MIVLTTPTGNVGGQLLADLLSAGTEPLRVIVRDPSRLDDAVREQVEVIAGSHNDPAVLNQALDGAQGLFWLVPPSMRASSAEEYYLSFTRPAVEAIRRHRVGHVVGISSAGWNWPHPAGLLSAAHAMDAELEGSGAAYRSLGMGFYMENLLRPLPQMTAEGVLSLPLVPDRPLALIATRDIADVATSLLLDRSWEGTDRVPAFSPDHLTPEEMAAIISDVLGSQVTFEQADLDQVTASTIERGVPEGMACDFAAMYRAQQDGIYDEDWSHATPTSTTFRTWCETVLVPAAR
ncbi:MAG TPA: NAD(P)H-binding protein [Solirubrobacteraceae bacterium]|jgi:uncharacterized protein YbjT (DUF2867 family)